METKPVSSPVSPPSLPKSQDLSPQQLAAAAEKRRLKKQVKEVLWPFLELGTKDLTEAVNFCDMIKLGIEGAWEQKKNRSTLGSLDMEKQANKTTEDWKKVKFVLDSLKDETVASAVNIMTSLKNLITDYGNTEISKKSMSELKSYFDKEFKDV